MVSFASGLVSFYFDLCFANNLWLLYLPFSVQVTIPYSDKCIFHKKDGFFTGSLNYDLSR